MINLRLFLRKSSHAIFTSGISRNMNTNARILVTPRVALNDVVPRIRVEGLPPKTAVTLRAEMFDDRGKQLLSNAHFLTDDFGIVDVTRSQSLGGSYEGTFPTGLLSTLKSADGSFAYGRVVQEDVTKPLQIKVLLHKGHVVMHTKDPALDEVTLERHFVGPGVKRIRVKTGRVRGALYLPAGDGIHPGVVEMYGAAGILYENRAALMASRGIATLCLAYFNHEDIPAEKLLHLDLEYFEEATEYLTSHPNVIPDRCGVLANCFGAVIAHTMAIHIEKVKALFAINFGQRCFGTFTRKGESLYYNEPWSPPGDEEPVSFLEGNKELTIPKPFLVKEFCRIKGSYVESLHKVSKEKYFKYAYGEDDSYPFMQSVPHIREAVGKDFDTNFEVKTYPLAGHMIDPPYSPAVTSNFLRFYGSSSDSGKTGYAHYWGGKPKHIVEMQESVYKDIFKFFNYHIRDCSEWNQEWLLKAKL